MRKPTSISSRTGSVRRQTASPKRSERALFAVCINNEGYKASLEVGKLYRILLDRDAAANGLIRVVDESGEDYAYATSRFHPMKVPSVIQRALSEASR